ncbi:MAG: hypothetical protein HZA10_06420 [Nitrospirae bacterium]|nr:hypothetical protein [Nitrospirota bacterium]
MRFLSFKNRLSDFYKNLPALKNELIFIENLMGNSLDLFTKTLELPLETEEKPKYELFKSRLMYSIKSWKEKKEKDVKTGLVIRSWLPKWELTISTEEANIYLKKLIDESIIEIQPDNPIEHLNGIIKIKS